MAVVTRAGAAADSCRGDADRPDRGAGGQAGRGFGGGTKRARPRSVSTPVTNGGAGRRRCSWWRPDRAAVAGRVRVRGHAGHAMAVAVWVRCRGGAGWRRADPARPARIRLTDEVGGRIGSWSGGTVVGRDRRRDRVSTATVRVALGRRRGSVGWESRCRGQEPRSLSTPIRLCCSLVAGKVESTAAAHQFAGDQMSRRRRRCCRCLADRVPRTDERRWRGTGC